MDWASGHGSNFFWYIFFILFSEANLCNRYCSQRRMPDETSKLLRCHVFRKWLSWDQNWLLPKCKVNRLLLESKVRAHFMTSKPSWRGGCWVPWDPPCEMQWLWRREEKRGFSSEFFLTLRLRGENWRGCGQETPITGLLLWADWLWGT